MLQIVESIWKYSNIPDVLKNKFVAISGIIDSANIENILVVWDMLTALCFVQNLLIFSYFDHKIDLILSVELHENILSLQLCRLH